MIGFPLTPNNTAYNLMKVVGAISILAGAALLTIWAGTWIAIISERGVTEAARRGFTVWPENVASFVMLAISLFFIGSGLTLLAHKQRPR